MNRSLHAPSISILHKTATPLITEKQPVELLSHIPLSFSVFFSVQFRLNKLNLLVQIKLMLVPLVQKEPSPTGPDRPTATQLTPLETEIIDFFVQLSRILGQPRSLAEIYGLLFMSGRPLAMDDLIERLQLSKGSASQGLKFLCKIGAARMVYIAGERRTHYEAVAELRNLATRFLRDQIVPHLDNGQARLGRIADMVKQLPLAERARINGRVKMLQSWERQGRRFFPLVVKILGK